MAEDDSSGVFALDEPALGFGTEGSAPGDGTSNHSSNPDDVFQGFFPPPNSEWNYSDPAHVNQSSTMPTTQAGYAATAWQYQGSIDPHLQNSAGQARAFVPQPHTHNTHNSPYSHPYPPPLQTTPDRDQQGHNPMSESGPHPTITPAVHEQLRNIAMPPSLPYKSPRSASSPDSARGRTKLEASSSPDSAFPPSKLNPRKRKISADADDEDEEDEDGKPIKKSAHNMIEKRYRTNLNDKIAALRDSVPSLRIMSKSARGEDTTEDREELHGLTPAHKLNKATVLSKATEYIRHLEKRNHRLLEETNAMQARIVAFEKLFMAGAMNGSISPGRHQPPPTPIQYGQDHQYGQHASVCASQDGNTSPAGMIHVPDDMKRIISAQMAAGRPYNVAGEPYQNGHPGVVRQQQIQQQRQGSQSRWSSAAPYVGKMMVGSLAGLMVLEAIREDEVSSQSTEGRGLYALPGQLMAKAASSLDLRVMGYHAHSTLKLLMLVGTLLWIFVPSLFANTRTKPTKPQVGMLQPAPSLASSIHVRQQAWLTAIQTVWVPKHNFLLEAAALLLKTVKLSLRNAIGIHGYQMITGLTEEQETARVQAWSIALDSQLAGGDVEINRSRLILTFLASGTLPDTPMRLMLKALHIRVLLWDLDYPGNSVVKAVAVKIARTKWNEARQLNQILGQLNRGAADRHEDELPEHLAALVDLACDEVFTDQVVQRAYNLAYNLETTYNVEATIDGMDYTVEDDAIASPLDAVAAWYTTEKVHDILTSSITDVNKDRGTATADMLTLALEVTPIGSAAQLRAAAARAVLVSNDRQAHIESLSHLLESETKSYLMNGSSSETEAGAARWDPDLRLALRCAATIDQIPSVKENLTKARGLLPCLNAITTTESQCNMSLLGFAAALEVMNGLFAQKESIEVFKYSLETMAGILRLWMGGVPGDLCGVSDRARHTIIERCLTVTKNLVGMEIDTGYGTMSDDEQCSSESEDVDSQEDSADSN